MLSSQDEACKLEFRSEMISYHSVHSYSFFFPTILPEKGLERYHCFLGCLLLTFHKKVVDFFFVGKKNAHVNVGYCLLISVMFHLSRLKYCFWSLESFKLSCW